MEISRFRKKIWDLLSKNLNISIDELRKLYPFEEYCGKKHNNSNHGYKSITKKYYNEFFLYYGYFTKLINYKVGNFIKTYEILHPKFEQPFYREIFPYFPELIGHYDDGHKIIDFYDPIGKLYIELDGNQHLEENQRRSDNYRDFFSLLNEGIPTLRWNSKILNNEWEYMIQNTITIINFRREMKYSTEVK